MFLRFVVSERHDDSDRDRGVFSALYALERKGELGVGEIEWFREAESWLNSNLPRPSRFAWSARPNAPERALSWFKDTATLHIARVRELTALLEHKGIPVAELRTDKPGYVLYEDDYQVVAMPFGRETFE
jgi:hypothetical protein